MFPPVFETRRELNVIRDAPREKSPYIFLDNIFKSAIFRKLGQKSDTPPPLDDFCF